MSLDAQRARVIAPRTGGAWVRLADGSTVFAKNQLNLRAPPKARVTVARDERGRYAIIGRER